MEKFCELADVEILDFLIKKGADINATINNGWTPLIRSSLGREENVRFLLKMGANVNAVNSVGQVIQIHKI